LPFVYDYAHVFSAHTVARVEQQIAAVRAQTDEALVVVTVAHVPAAEIEDAVDDEAAQYYAQHGVHGSLLYVDRDDRRDALIAEPAAWFPLSDVSTMRQALEARFGAGEYDAGLVGLTSSILHVYEHGGGSPERNATIAAPRARLYGIAVAALLAYLLVRAALRREGA
jgi:uncharacterized membrane protein YgcG